MTTKSSAKRTKPRQNVGLVLPGISYPLKQFIELLGINRNTLIGMRRKGLKVRKDGKYLVILGEDYHEYTKTLPVAEIKPRSVSK